jgi:Schlafen, AlbA_2
MQADLFSADLAKLTENDVKEFLALERPEAVRQPEGPTIDYKEHLPSDIGDDVAAMSNTFGGLVFIGVKADKARQNIPVAMDGDNIGSDAKARVTDKIIATVHPRPQIDIGVVPLSGRKEVVAVIRVRKGQIPPYQFEQGATVRIPIRVIDTNRQARVSEIEELLRQRNSLNGATDEIAEQYLRQNRLILTRQDSTGQVLEADYHSLLLIPRAPTSRRLDSRFERTFERVIAGTFLTARTHLEHARSGSFHEVIARSKDGPVSNRRWVMWSSGSVGFVGPFVSDGSDRATIGDVARDLLFFFRAASLIQNEFEYFGPNIFRHSISCDKVQFEPEFPPPGGRGSYDKIRGIVFPTPRPSRCPRQSVFFEDVERDTLKAPEQLIADVLLAQFRETCGAQIDFQELAMAIQVMSKQSLAS